MIAFVLHHCRHELSGFGRWLYIPLAYMALSVSHIRMSPVVLRDGGGCNDIGNGVRRWAERACCVPWLCPANLGDGQGAAHETSASVIASWAARRVLIRLR